ncbi:MAG: hypothetical protein AAGA30_13220 [Planctomycetota bacterium]
MIKRQPTLFTLFVIVFYVAAFTTAIWLPTENQSTIFSRVIITALSMLMLLHRRFFISAFFNSSVDDDDYEWLVLIPILLILVFAFAAIYGNEQHQQLWQAVPRQPRHDKQSELERGLIGYEKTYARTNREPDRTQHL